MWGLSATALHRVLCEGRSRDNLSEWLRRQTRNLLGFARAGSNPAVVVFPFLLIEVLLLIFIFQSIIGIGMLLILTELYFRLISTLVYEFFSFRLPFPPFLESIKA